MSKTELSPDWRESRRQSARAAILEAAWAAVRDEGLAALSLRDLARRAGITTPTVYAYFESKNSIYDAMFGQAAAGFERTMGGPYDVGAPREVLVASLRRFIEFCTADIPRYQLLFQRTIPGFRPSPESYEPAVRALVHAREVLALNGATRDRQLDLWTALTIGLVDQQIANEPGGDRWVRLSDDLVTMFLTYCNPPKAARKDRK
ncbi:MAG TPA: TetR/AcrR family transcriptional regulator [Acidimicrobiales bacterium]|nr:TetR/AcrR family transcriptional regulator [Acidimicrobiales bacterium]